MYEEPLLPPKSVVKSISTFFTCRPETTSLQIISVTACVRKHLVLTSIRFPRTQTQSRKPPAGSNQKAHRLSRKHNLLEIIGPTCRCVIRWNMLCCRQSMCHPTSVLWGWGEEVSQGGENKSIASGKATSCYLKYAICPDIRITQEARYDLWKVTSVVLCRRGGQVWGLPGTKFPCTTSLYAHHPSWIFGGLGCAVGW